MRAIFINKETEEEIEIDEFEDLVEYSNDKNYIFKRMKLDQLEFLILNNTNILSDIPTDRPEQIKIWEALIENDYYLVEYLPNQIEELQLLSIELSRGQSLKYIKNPTKRVEKRAVEINGFEYRYIKNPSKEIREFALKKEPRIIEEYIDNPTEEEKLEAWETITANRMTNFDTNLYLNKNLSYESKMYLINKYEDILLLLKEVDIQMIFTHLRKWGIINIDGFNMKDVIKIKNKIKSKNEIIEALSIITENDNDFYREVAALKTIPELKKELDKHW